jgi:hypothetical protein
VGLGEEQRLIARLYIFHPGPWTKIDYMRHAGGKTVAMRPAWLLAGLLATAGLLMTPTDLSSCGPFFTTAVFSFVRHPESPKERFALGEVGILDPAFPRFYLFIAYRYLSGLPLNPAEQQALFREQPSSPSTGFSNEWGVEITPAVTQWIELRKKAPGLALPAKGGSYRTESSPTSYVQYLNCGDDAYRTAIATLQARIVKWGGNSAQVKDWIQAQDMVFSDCVEGSSIPPAAPAAADPLLKQDRAYQIAAANFYSGNLNEAEAQFRRVASDQASPWRPISSYLVARALIRKASLKGEADALAAAETQLKTVLADSSLQSAHPPAQALAGYVEARRDPGQRLRELAQALLTPNQPAAIEQNLTDYRYLFDRLEEADQTEFANIAARHELGDWLLSFHAADRADHALEKWKSTNSNPWLLAALAHLGGDSPDAGVAIAAAERIPSDSPAYATAAFHATRLLIETHKLDQARSRLDAVLKDAKRFPRSTTNLFLAERMKVAASWDEFLRFAPRAPAGWAEDIDEEAFDPNTRPELKVYSGGRPAFDADATVVFNEQMPLARWMDAAGGAQLPAPLRASLALTGWVRAVLLDDDQSAVRFAALAETLNPEFKRPLESYLAASSADARRFASTYALLKYPGLRPYLESGFDRLTAIDKIDDYRDNWWCALGSKHLGFPANYYRLYSSIARPLDVLYSRDAPSAAIFLAPAELDAGRNEWKRLGGQPAAPTYLLRQALDFAQAHPDDPRGPEALHLGVRASRYGCTDANTGTLSEQAWRLLHQRFRDSPWTKQTQYWYK